MRASLRHVVMWILAVPLAALGHATGISGYTGQTADCTSCHTAGAHTPTVKITGPTALKPGATGSYTLSITGGPAVVGGLDVGEPSGAATLGTTDPHAFVSSGEVTQSAPVAFSANGATFSFTVTAPNSTGTLTLYGAGLSGDGDGSQFNDGTATTQFSISVSQDASADAGSSSDGGTPGRGGAPNAGCSAGGSLVSVWSLLSLVLLAARALRRVPGSARRLARLPLALALAFVIQACGPTSSTSPPNNSKVAPDGGTVAVPNPGVIQKVFYLMEENRDSTNVYGANDAPFINGTLMATYDWASDYTNVIGPSEPNYIWMEAGDNLGMTTDNDPSPSNSSATHDFLVNYLGRVGKSWKSYQENLPGSCGIYSSGQYAAKHNPFVFFQDVVGDYANPSAYCTSHIVDLSALSLDFANNSLADFIEITPNLCNDGHDCANPTVEAFLQSTVIQQVFNYVLNPSNHAILIIDWDESELSNLHPMLLVAPPSTLAGAHQITTQVDHSSFVRSMQRIFGVDPAHTDPTTKAPFGWLGAAATARDFSSFFVAGQFP